MDPKAQRLAASKKEINKLSAEIKEEKSLVIKLSKDSREVDKNIAEHNEKIKSLKAKKQDEETRSRIAELRKEIAKCEKKKNELRMAKESWTESAILKYAEKKELQKPGI